MERARALGSLMGIEVLEKMSDAQFELDDLEGLVGTGLGRGCPRLPRGIRGVPSFSFLPKKQPSILSVTSRRGKQLGDGGGKEGEAEDEVFLF